jgi:hypothetical protein
VRSRLVRLNRVGLTPDSPRADRRPFQEKRSVCRLILVRPNRSPSVGLQKVRCSACCGRYADSCCNGTILRTEPTGAIRAVAVLGGQSGFSPETARSTSTRSATPASHRTQSREPQDGIRGSRAACRRVTPYPQESSSEFENPFAFPRPGTPLGRSTEVRPQPVGRGVDGPVYAVARGRPRPSD